MENTFNWFDSRYAGICVNPAATIRTVVDRDPRDKVISLVLVDSLIGPLWLLVRRHAMQTPLNLWIAGERLYITIPDSLWLIIWPLAALLLLYVNGALICWIGSRLGGTAKTAEVRAALAWPKVFHILTSPLVLLVGIEMSSPLHLLWVWMGWSVQPPSLLQTGFFSNLPAFWRWILPIALGAPLWLWYLVISVKCVAEVHRFSVWRGLGTWLLEYPVLLCVLIIVELLVNGFAAVAIRLF